MINYFKNVKSERWLKRYIKFINIFSLNECDSDTQRHHILPKSIYKDYEDFNLYTWNLSFLSPRAHYLAHFMLAKALEGNMWYAWNIMNNSNGFKLNSKLYDVGRREHSKVVSKHMKENNPSKRPEVIEKIKKANIGRKASEETKLKMSLNKQDKPLVDVDISNIEFLLKTNTVYKVSKITGISIDIINHRIRVNKLKVPVKLKKEIDIADLQERLKFKSKNKVSKDLGVSITVITNRIKKHNLIEHCKGKIK